MRLPCLDAPSGDSIMEDGVWWETPEDFNTKQHNDKTDALLEKHNDTNV
jgi:hypothetical protein